MTYLTLTCGFPLGASSRASEVGPFLLNHHFLETALLDKRIIHFKETSIPLILELPEYISALLDKDFP